MQWSKNIGISDFKWCQNINFNFTETHGSQLKLIRPFFRGRFSNEEVMLKFFSISQMMGKDPNFFYMPKHCWTALAVPQIFLQIIMVYWNSSGHHSIPFKINKTLNFMSKLHTGFYGWLNAFIDFILILRHSIGGVETLRKLL